MATKQLAVFTVTLETELELPLVSDKVNAGFPSPADDYLEPSIDLNKRLVTNPNATFLVRVSGTSMINAGIHPGDMLVVDKSREPKEGSIIVAEINNEYTLKRYSIKNGKPQLLAENPDFPPICFSESDEAVVWGVVTHCIKDF